MQNFMRRMFRSLWQSTLQQLIKLLQCFQQYIFSALNLPVSDYTFDDCKLMEFAENLKMPFASKIAEISKLREKIG